MHDFCQKEATEGDLIQYVLEDETSSNIFWVKLTHKYIKKKVFFKYMFFGV